MPVIQLAEKSFPALNPFHDTLSRRILKSFEGSLRTPRLKARNNTMSEFPEIQPFGPRPAPQNGDPIAEGAEAVTQPEPVATASGRIFEEPTAASGSHLNVTLILTAAAAGFALGYVLARYQEVLVRESKLDALIDSTQAWIRDQAPKIADPIRQGLESAGSTWDQAVKKVGSGRPMGLLRFLHR